MPSCQECVDRTDSRTRSG
nr:unnamed protein product [Callosobruchus chinensis]